MKFPFKQIILARAIAQRAKPYILHLKNLSPHEPFLPGNGEPNSPRLAGEGLGERSPNTSGAKWHTLFLVAFIGSLTQIPVKPAFAEVLTVQSNAPPPPADRSAPAGRRQGGASRSPGTLLFKAPPPPADRSAPAGRQRGGASRGTCPAAIGEEPLTALVPATQTSLNEGQSGNSPLKTFESVWALTAAEAPTFWYYIPYALTPDLPVEFILQDDQGNNVYQTKFIASQKQPGVVKVRLPATIAPLKVGKMYRWFFMIDCDPDAPPLVEGSVQRIAPSATLMSQLQKATPRERVVLYAKQGIWHDALTALAELRSANPNDAALTNDWVSLLNSGGLEAIAQEPVIDCCTAQQQ
ncbi:DUF928 domain-containing protein [Coleofasciculus sp. FACHB-T130]|uniref:DUF928 domain-containing protein n=1 Tax=Cyanophyceae TaxID=3028117 RepID=UPI0016849629|nr:DUF928 domain-containing protein [Coleofasciculus sp. FACHB-T130]MBD1881823.1 DUF928 domain-containing protein [Coleofasciculus sp. FACHB-T130]